MGALADTLAVGSEGVGLEDLAIKVVGPHERRPGGHLADVSPAELRRFPHRLP
jgi:hypothetical protein